MKDTGPYSLLPQPQSITYGSGGFDTHYMEWQVVSNSFAIGEKVRKSLPLCMKGLAVQPQQEGQRFFVQIGKTEELNKQFPLCELSPHLQGYLLIVEPEYVYIASLTERGLFYGFTTWQHLLVQREKSVTSLTIQDWPVLDNRGLMLDISRGRVFTLEHLKDVVLTLASMKMNVLQLYVEHTFDFSFLSDVHEGTDPITSEEIQILDAWCRENHIELQANLQSFGHCNRLLTTDGYRHLRESDLYWTLSPSVEESYTLLDRMYSEYLPNFTSSILNVDSDETYDLGSDKSASLMKAMGQGPLYLQHLLRLRSLAKKQGKTLMVFGDVILNHPELLKEVPDDIIFLDWIYDPLETYPTPSKFAKAGKTFWVCPGTGAWNSLFPRQEGAYRNITDLTLEGIAQGTEGMLLCDWGDHGAYSMPAFTYFSYATASSVSWTGKDSGHESISRAFALCMEEPSLQQLHTLLPEIHRLPALWSKNRSQCVIALFDEPLLGRMLTHPLPPEDLLHFKALPQGVAGVLDKESHHLMRPLFSLSEETLASIKGIAEKARPLTKKLSSTSLKAQYGWLCDALDLLSDKVSLGREIRQHFKNTEISCDLILDWERALRLMIGRYATLEMDFIDIWRTFAKQSEIAITLTYFAHIIERLDYLKAWLCRQREALQTNHEVDYAFASYETAGYKSLPTY
ncbi:MAG: glycoside hydrolase family 20 zincin-like fold domain-containing protein [Sphaerochaeta sp.]|nr:glycoside hydrolase family 20 zincin-like fold domain-containing protein [Sphaerochaeta sp.]